MQKVVIPIEIIVTVRQENPCLNGPCEKDERIECENCPIGRKHLDYLRNLDWQ